MNKEDDIESFIGIAVEVIYNELSAYIQISRNVTDRDFLVAEYDRLCGDILYLDNLKEGFLNVNGIFQFTFKNLWVWNQDVKVYFLNYVKKNRI